MAKGAEDLELRSGVLTFDQIEDEIETMISLLQEAEIHAVFISYGFGCNCDDLDETADIPVATSLLADFIDESGDRGIYTFGEADLEIRSEGGEVQFVLCHESDVHCSGTNAVLVERIRRRWTQLFPDSYELDGKGNWKRLANPVEGGRLT
jgi:hypothetical protein